MNLEHPFAHTPGKQSGTASPGAERNAQPGKSTLTESMAPIQRREQPGGPRPKDGGGEVAVQAQVQRAAASPGAPLPREVAGSFGRSLGADLNAVRVHTGGESAQAATGLGALAYTQGQSIHFADGQYDPASERGRHLLAHEVAHTVQQGGRGGAVQTKLEVGAPGDAAEHQADAAADAMVAGQSASVTSMGGGVVRRYPQARPGHAGQYIDPDYPRLVMTKPAEGHWSEYVTQDGAHVFYDEGKYWADRDGIQPADMSAYLVQNNANGATYNYRQVDGTALMPLDDVLGIVSNLRSDLDDGRCQSALAEMQKGEVVHPIEITIDKDGKYHLVQGNHRLWAARKLKLKLVPVICKSNFHPSKKDDHERRDGDRDADMGVAFKLEAGGARQDGARVGAIAAEGMRGAGQPLPHRDQIQASFGRHDVSDVRAHVGPAATAASEQLGAAGYAASGAVAFRGDPDLHLAAHEAAHVVQQRAGVQLSAHGGAAGDTYERHADAVADRVVAGHSAEALLDTHAGGGGSSSGAVQRQLRWSGMGNVYDDTRGYGYGFEHEGGNRYRLYDTGVVYNYNAQTQQYIDDNGVHFDAETQNLFYSGGNGWYWRVDGSPGYYYYHNFHYVLYQQTQTTQDQLTTSNTSQSTQSMSLSTYGSQSQQQHQQQPKYGSLSLGSSSQQQQQQPISLGSYNQQQQPQPLSYGSGYGYGSQSLSQTPYGSLSLGSTYGYGSQSLSQTSHQQQQPQPQKAKRKWTHNGTYWESDDGYQYFPSRSSLAKNWATVEDDTILQEVQPLEEDRKKSTKSQSGMRFMISQRKETVDDYIKGCYEITIGSNLIQFKIEGELAGEISWYDFNGHLSFDVSKLEKYEGEHAGIGSMLIYWLMKYGNTGYKTAQIEAFDSGRDVKRLEAWYKRHGFNSGMFGYLDEIQSACELEIRSRMK